MAGNWYIFLIQDGGWLCRRCSNMRKKAPKGDLPSGPTDCKRVGCSLIRADSPTLTVGSRIFPAKLLTYRSRRRLFLSQAKTCIGARSNRGRS